MQRSKRSFDMNDLSQQLADFLDEEPDPEWTHYKKFFFYMQIESEKRPSPPSPFISQWPSSTNLPPSEPSPLLLRHSPRPHRSEPGIARTSPTALGYSPAAASLGAAMSDQRLWIIAAVLVLAFLLGLVA